MCRPAGAILCPSPALMGGRGQAEKEIVMLKKTAAATVLAATALLGATPALADGYRHPYPQKRVVVVHQQVPYHAHRRAVVHRPVVVHRHVQRPVVVRHQPTVVYRQSSSHDVLGGLIVGAVLGAVIASHAAY
jgi:hypothetical protein